MTVTKKMNKENYMSNEGKHVKMGGYTQCESCSAVSEYGANEAPLCHVL